MKLSNDLGKDSVLGLVLKLAVPTILAQLVNLLYSIVDRMYIGHIPVTGSLALAGVGICAPITTFLSSFGTLIGIGGSIIMSIKMGENKEKEAEHILANSFFALSITGIALTILFLILKNKCIMLFGGSATTFSYANTYLTIYTLGTFFALMAIGLNYFIACQGFPMISMCSVIIGAVTNIVLDTIFIFKMGMGIAGAAWATVIAQTLSFSFAFFYLKTGRTPISIVFRGFSFATIKRIVKFGISPFFIITTDSLIIIVLNAMLQKYGGPEKGDLLISSAAIIQSYILLITGPLLGITGGTQPILSYNYGAKYVDRVKKAEKCILIFALLLTGTIFISTRTIAPYFIKFFTDDAELTRVAYAGIIASVWGIVPLSFQYALVDCLTAISRIKTAFILSMFRKGIYTVSVCILPMFFSVETAFYAQSIGDVIGPIFCIITFVLVFNKHLENRLHQN